MPAPLSGCPEGDPIPQDSGIGRCLQRPKGKGQDGPSHPFDRRRLHRLRLETLQIVQHVSGNDLDALLAEQLDGLIGLVEAEDDYGRLGALLDEGVHVLHVDSAL